MSLPTLQWKAGDEGLSRTVTCVDTDGAAAVLTGATIRWLMSPWNAAGRYIAGDPVVTAELSGDELVDLSAGQVARDRDAAADTAAAGTFAVEVEVTYSGGAVQTFPEVGYIIVTVTEDLA